MALHVREQIAAAVVTALTGLGTTAANVFRDRDTEANPLQATELPGLVVVDDGDPSEVISFGLGFTLKRDMTLAVEAHVKAGSGAGTTLNQILKEVEVALAAAALGGAKSAELAEVAAREVSEAAETPTMRQKFTFRLTYYTARSAPDVAL